MGITKTDASQQAFLYALNNNTGDVVRIATSCDLQVGTSASPAELHLTGDLSVSTSTVTQTMSTLTVNPNVSILNVFNQSGGTVTVTLPPKARVGQLLTVKDASRTATTHNLILISGEVGITVESNSSLAMTSNGSSVTLVRNDSDWSCVSNYSVGGGGGGDTTSSYVTINNDTVILPNSRRLTAGSGVSFTDGGAGSTFTISSTGGSTDAVWIDGNKKTYTTSSVSISKGAVYASSVGSDVFFYVSGSKAPARTLSSLYGSSVFGGDLLTSGSVTSFGGISGSLTRLTDGTSYLIGGQGVNITSASNSAVTLSISDSIIPFISGATFTGNVSAPVITATKGLSGSLTKLSDGTSYLIAGSGISITSASNGAVTVASVKVPIFTLQIAASQQTTNVSSSIKYAVGACYYEPAIVNQFVGSKAILWRAIVESSNSNFTASMDLYDVNGITGGTSIPAQVVGSAIQSNSVGAVSLQADITSVFTGISVPVLLEGRLWMSPTSSTGDMVTCRNARIDVEFT